MKQAELNKLFNQLNKDIGNDYGWKNKSGILYVKKGSLLFVLIAIAQAKTNRIIYCLDYKFFDFDEVFWDIVGMKENTKQPLSLHATGAFVAPTKRIMSDHADVIDWTDYCIKESIVYIMQKVDELVSKITCEITTLEENLTYLENLLVALRERSPQAVSNIYVEILITAIMKKEYVVAFALVEDRIKQNDSGGFEIGGKTLYELAYDYLCITTNSARNIT